MSLGGLTHSLALRIRDYLIDAGAGTAAGGGGGGRGV